MAFAVKSSRNKTAVFRSFLRDPLLQEPVERALLK